MAQDKFVRELPVWPETESVPASARQFFYHPETDREYQHGPGQLPGRGALPGANELRGADKLVDFLAPFAGMPAWATTRAELAAGALVIGTVVLVRNPAPNPRTDEPLPPARYELVEQVGGEVLAYYNAGGKPADPLGFDRAPATWQDYAGGGDGGAFTLTPTVELGGVAAGVELTGTSRQILTKLLVKYLAPAFSAFRLGGQGSQAVEVGTAFPAGFKSFTWATSQPQNVAPGSLRLRDETAGTVLAEAEADDGALSASTAAFTAQLGVSRRYVLSGLTTENQPFGAELVLSGAHRLFFGPAAGAPADSAAVRALPQSRLISEGLVFTLDTGTAATRFALVVPPGYALASVVDVDAANQPITGDYAAQGALSVADAAGAAVGGYTRYLKTQAAPYGISHRHLITLRAS